jgi:hypothetical protein
MTFTYEPSTTPSDLLVVRYHIADTEEDYAMFSDEEIQMVLALEGGSVNKAVINLINGTIARLAQEPDMTADWLTISWRRSADAWKSLLAEKKKAFGLGFSLSTTQVDPYRKDSLQGPVDGQTTYTPDYADKRTTDYQRREREHRDDDIVGWD